MLARAGAGRRGTSSGHTCVSWRRRDARRASPRHRRESGGRWRARVGDEGQSHLRVLDRQGQRRLSRHPFLS